VVILYPVAQTWGLSGLLVATVMSGVILVGMALLRLGRLIQYIPESVVLGFTGGIAVVIVTLQLKDLFGLPVAVMPEHFIDKLQVLAANAGGVHWPSVAIAFASNPISRSCVTSHSAPRRTSAAKAGSVLTVGMRRNAFRRSMASGWLASVRASTLSRDGCMHRRLSPNAPRFVRSIRDQAGHHVQREGQQHRCGEHRQQPPFQRQAAPPRHEGILQGSLSHRFHQSLHLGVTACGPIRQVASAPRAHVHGAAGGHFLSARHAAGHKVSPLDGAGAKPHAALP
jgi:hypothetical protein